MVANIENLVNLSVCFSAGSTCNIWLTQKDAEGIRNHIHSNPNDTTVAVCDFWGIDVSFCNKDVVAVIIDGSPYLKTAAIHDRHNRILETEEKQIEFQEREISLKDRKENLERKQRKVGI